MGVTLAFNSGAAQGNTLTVTKADDTNDGVCDADCSLREAIAAANPGDTVDVPADTYTLTLSSELTISKSLILSGVGAATTIIQAGTSTSGATSRVFTVTADVAPVAISGVTIRHGNTNGRGGGILNAGTLTVTDSSISDNTAELTGGGIHNNRTLTLANITISGNTVSGAVGAGGGIFNSCDPLPIPEFVCRGVLTLIRS